MSTTPSQQPIVVGVDGSPEAAAALAWAIEEARIHEVPLSILHAFRVPRTEVNTIDHGMYPDFATEARKVLEHVLEAAPSMDDLKVTHEIEAGSPAHVLVEASREASLLVVGARGHGGFDGLALGSVSTQCAHHAHCPVVVVRT